jgi:hypothetical protein
LVHTGPLKLPVCVSLKIHLRENKNEVRLIDLNDLNIYILGTPGYRDTLSPGVTT